MAKLYIVPTPIGNLQDITLRALEVLKSVDFILCEDTRTSSILLNHYAINKPLISFHKFNEHSALQTVIQKIKMSESSALISDAGTPAISDPGFLLVRECIKNEIETEVLPGATAFVPALVNSGFACDSFLFFGFLPIKKGRQTAWKQIAQTECTVVLYESPYRIVKLLEEIKTYIGEQTQVSISREISKKFEQTVRGNVHDVWQHFVSTTPKGEFVVVIERK